MDVDALVKANAAFYDAFARRDAAAMERIWSSRHPIVCGHPGWPLLEGREHVLGSWRAILESADPPEVRCTASRAMQGGGLGCVVCTELVDGQELLATNVFVLEDGAWKMVHHHASQVSARAPKPPKADDWLN